MQILNGNEAFTALMAGKKILCRAVGGLMEFDDLDQFPATIFATSGYEFSIKIDLIEVAGITFTKPLTLDELVDGQDVFVINTYSASIYVVNFKTSALVEAINSGFVQRDAENAKLQLKALSKVLGCNLDSDYSIIRLGDKIAEPEEEKPKKRRAKKEAFTVDEVPAVETDPEKLIANFTAQINECESVDAVLSVRSTFACNGHLDREHVQVLCKLVEEKIAELDPETYAPQAEIIEDNLLEFKAKPMVDEDALYQENLKDLIERANQASTPVEANALLKYTASWEPEQRTPLIQAINNRMIVLGQQKEKPSLMVQIQRAKDLTELDALEIDVAECDAEIQPKLMQIVAERRVDLNKESFFKRAMEKIKTVRTQEALNDLMICPEFYELNNEDKKMLTDAASKRSGQIQSEEI